MFPFRETEVEIKKPSVEVTKTKSTNQETSRKISANQSVASSSSAPVKKQVNTYFPEIDFLTVDEFEPVPKYVQTHFRRYLRIEWRPVCVHVIWTRLVIRQIGKRQQSRSYRMNANRSSINTYIYIFQHNLCLMQVFNLVFDS